MIIRFGDEWVLLWASDYGMDCPLIYHRVVLSDAAVAFIRQSRWESWGDAAR